MNNMLSGDNFARVEFISWRALIGRGARYHRSPCPIGAASHMPD